MDHVTPSPTRLTTAPARLPSPDRLADRLLDYTLVAGAVALADIGLDLTRATHTVPGLWWPSAALVPALAVAIARMAPVSASLLAGAAAVLVAFFDRPADWLIAWPVGQFVGLLVTLLVAVSTAPGRVAPWIAAGGVALMLLQPTDATRLWWALGVLACSGAVLVTRRSWPSPAGSRP